MIDNDGKTQFPSIFRTFGEVQTTKSGTEDLPKYTIEEFVPDIHNCVDTPQISLRNYQEDVAVRPTKACSSTMDFKWLEINMFKDH
jgi:hypothetical protein